MLKNGRAAFAVNRRHGHSQAASVSLPDTRHDACLASLAYAGRALIGWTGDKNGSGKTPQNGGFVQ
jgi:hypothetical protein